MSQGVTGRARQKGRVMRFIRKAMIGLAALAALPLAAQGPVPAPAAKTTEATVPAAKTQAAPAPLDPKDLEAWMDGYQIGRAHVCTPVTNVPFVCLLLLDIQII